MYNGIGLRTVRGSGTNGYVQRNLSHVNASRTRQTLARNQRGGSSGGFEARGGGRNRPPPNSDILLHDQKRKVELQLLEMSLEMEDRGCDPEEIQDKVNRERERLLKRLNDVDAIKQGNEKASESSHARQKRKQEENARMKKAFGIATDYVAGESFDPEMQEQRRQQRKEKREQEWKEREEARQQRMKERDEREDKMRARRERSRSGRSRSRSHSRKPRQEKRAMKDSATRKKKQSRRSRSSSFSSSSSGSSSASDHSRSPSRRREKPKIAKEKVKVEQLTVGVSSARAAVLKGEHKVLNLTGRNPLNDAVANDDSPPKAIKKEEELQRSTTAADVPEKKVESLPAAPAQEEANARHPRSPAVDSRSESRKLCLLRTDADVDESRAPSRPEPHETLAVGVCTPAPTLGPVRCLRTDLVHAQLRQLRQLLRTLVHALVLADEATQGDAVVARAAAVAATAVTAKMCTALAKRQTASVAFAGGGMLHGYHDTVLARNYGRGSSCIEHGVNRDQLGQMPMSSASSTATAATDSTQSTSISIPDDGRPFLSDPSGSSSPSGSLASTATPGGCARVLQRRFPRVRRCLTRVSMSVPTSRAASGLTVIVALLMVGIVGTFALHQMMSPEIEALTQQREKLKDDVMALRLQMENMTRIAESRLETIHLLETELERQHVQAAEAAATATTDTNHGAIPNVANEELKSGGIRPKVVLPTIFYTLLLGSVLLASVLYRIFLIVRSEIATQHKLGKKQYVGGSGSTGPMMPSVSESFMDARRSGRGTPPLSPTRGPVVDDSVSTTTSNGANSSLSPKATGEPSPQCYKRAPGSSPTIV
ncbi:Serine/arginine repetitive matrix protein 2 [Phytophthora citrophthora]|uniref:Serine/arginine repetitive matrix protein 2 n=1 Tax=Phytophthora citrophthora TaxID=4793 RepID=A0AAD9FYV0_9STRA|nr:Serine/arginine repetitive matrix protein 2 [Phytophthora citrophthora]